MKLIVTIPQRVDPMIQTKLGQMIAQLMYHTIGAAPRLAFYNDDDVTILVTPER